jgi:hypothetical protein
MRRTVDGMIGDSVLTFRRRPRAHMSPKMGGRGKGTEGGWVELNANERSKNLCKLTVGSNSASWRGLDLHYSSNVGHLCVACAVELSFSDGEASCLPHPATGVWAAAGNAPPAFDSLRTPRDPLGLKSSPSPLPSSPDRLDPNQGAAAGVKGGVLKSRALAVDPGPPYTAPAPLPFGRAFAPETSCDRQPMTLPLLSHAICAKGRTPFPPTIARSALPRGPVLAGRSASVVTSPRRVFAWHSPKRAD